MVVEKVNRLQVHALGRGRLGAVRSRPAAIALDVGLEVLGGEGGLTRPGTCDVGAVLSTRNSIFPALSFAHRLAPRRSVTEPALGAGHEPARAEHPARASPPGPSCPGWRPPRRTSSPAALHLLHHERRRPRSRRRRPRWPPSPSRPWRRPGRAPTCRCRAGRTTVPRTCWSACRGSTPRWVDTSTVSSNLALAVALDDGDGVLDGITSVAIARTVHFPVGLAVLHAVLTSLERRSSRDPTLRGVVPLRTTSWRRRTLSSP